jgi:hypothetical protein
VRFARIRRFRGSPRGTRIKYESDIPLTVEEAQQRLEDGEPSIRTCYLELSDGEFEIGTAMLKEEELDPLVRRVREVLTGES